MVLFLPFIAVPFSWEAFNLNDRRNWISFSTVKKGTTWKQPSDRLSLPFPFILLFVISAVFNIFFFLKLNNWCIYFSAVEYTIILNFWDFEFFSIVGVTKIETSNFTTLFSITDVATAPFSVARPVRARI